ncbi:MAG TPA: methylmalonyl-CoA mutase family protein, partial [Saprospiraceae bacterium]|nr:methylmalonyl-CoA mutase family protein [Saprospiraceae bacterium]
MIQYDDFLSEFPPISKEAWMQQVAKDLKGKPLADLVWHTDEGLEFSPFVHADDFDAPPAPLGTSPKHWEICEAIGTDDPVSANRQALDALEGGAWGLELRFAAAPTLEHLSTLFEGIYLDFIGLHFVGAGAADNPAALLGLLERVAQRHQMSGQKLRGSFGYDPAHQAASAALQPDWRYVADVLHHAEQHFPQFRLLSLSGDQPDALLRRANTYLEKLGERGLTPDQVAAQMQFVVHIGPHYFPEMARLRALQVVWLNMLKAWGAAPRSAVLAVAFQPAAYTDDLYTNMIRATTMSMSAVLGGADRLTVL